MGPPAACANSLISASPAERPTTETCAPDRASANAISRPMPRVPPTTSARLPCIACLSSPNASGFTLPTRVSSGRESMPKRARRSAGARRATITASARHGTPSRNVERIGAVNAHSLCVSCSDAKSSDRAINKCTSSTRHKMCTRAHQEAPF